MSSNYFMDHYTLNGDTVLIQDRGRAQPNGVATIDANSKLPMNQMPDWANSMHVSRNDPYDMTIKEWADTLGSSAFKNRGVSWSTSFPEETANVRTSMVVKGGALFVANITVGSYSWMFWSEDGKNWTQGREYFKAEAADIIEACKLYRSIGDILLSNRGDQR